MELTERQKEGLDIAIRRFLQQQKYTVIAGYAGTRKKHISKIYYFRSKSI